MFGNTIRKTHESAGIAISARRMFAAATALMFLAGCSSNGAGEGDAIPEPKLVSAEWSVNQNNQILRRAVLARTGEYSDGSKLNDDGTGESLLFACIGKILSTSLILKSNRGYFLSSNPVNLDPETGDAICGGEFPDSTELELIVNNNEASLFGTTTTLG